MKTFLNNLNARAGGATTGNDVIEDALVAVRKHLGMEVAYLSEFVDGRSVFRRVDAPGLEHLIKTGDSQSLDDVYCNHILAGRLPELMPDTSREPLAVAMPITEAVPIGSHVSIPILLADGTPYGMFCCLSPRPNPTLNHRDLETMRMFATLVATQVNTELEEVQEGRAKRAAVEAVIRDRSFETVFQPIVDIVSMQVVAVEALSRFTAMPVRTPDVWVADAAEAGLGLDLELMLVEAAVAAFPTLPSTTRLSVNVSPATVLSGRLAEVLDHDNLARTTLEITEHRRVDDYAALHRALAGLRERGVKVAADDAGAGYSGLQHIVQLAPDVIKIDMSLTRGVDTDPARRALVSAMMFYARETGAVLIAEGIETAGELAALRSLGITRGQGYLLGRPASIVAAGAASRAAPTARQIELSDGLPVTSPVRPPLGEAIRIG